MTPHEWDDFIARPKRLDGIPTFREEQNNPSELRAHYAILLEDGRLSGKRLTMVAYPGDELPAFTFLIARPTLLRVTVSFQTREHANVDGPEDWPRLVVGPRWYPYQGNRSRINPVGKEGRLLAKPLPSDYHTWEAAFGWLCMHANIMIAVGQPPAFPRATGLFGT